MKKLKYCLFLIVSFVLAFSVTKVFALPERFSASGEMSPAHPILNYVTLSAYGETITYDNLKAVADERGSVTYYIFTTKPISINFKPLEYNYRNFSSYTENFYRHTVTITVNKDEDGNYARQFEYDGRTYYFGINNSRTLSIYDTEPASSFYTSPLVDSVNSELISCNTEFDDKIEIYITESYTLKIDNASGLYNIPFNFSVYQYQAFSIMFVRPSVDFEKDEFVQFDSYSAEFGEDHQIDSGLAPELSLNRLKITFLNDKFNYTEETPLYFDINYNGFIYTFRLFIDGEYLFVNYNDENESQNNRYLATHLISVGNTGESGSPNLQVDPSHTVPKTDKFSMTFNKIGRYEIKFYDDSYLTGIGDTNYYETSFYIKEASSAGNSLFDNIYIVSQVNYDEEIPNTDPELEPTYRHVEDYIVDSSTQNHAVKSTIKNLIDTSGTKELKDVIKYVIISKTLYGTNNNITDYDAYIPIGSTYKDEIYTRDGIATDHLTVIEDLEELKPNAEVSLLENGDMQFNFSSDGYYRITVVSTPTAEGTSPEKTYSFFIVTTAKANYTIEGVVHQATEDYVTQTERYQEKINNSDLEFVVNHGASGDFPTNLNKTYINYYSVSYGRQKVNVTASIGKDSITISFQGIGELSVNVTFNGETTPYTLNSEEGNGSLTFYDYGTYTVSLVDSMGTSSGEMTFTLSKKLNTSSIVLIVLSSVILIVIGTFVFLSRAKPRTR